ncbi:MAG: L-2-amino-thiazoline-4-carboxylic acid hydrolase [Methanomassiliicoccales archaeon]|nr:L-2-amino-thiazoline-4-carboxylic acid hydrolase [Methanomassiliicoccales archaeon]NYT15022.1 L-2-amino-thiazoline-4-carboxylic acid hydrolase [Methanomassiliicoccales archaeon]
MMLRLLSLYAPKRILLRELRKVSEATLGALDSLVKENCPNTAVEDLETSGIGLESLREQMAILHEQRVSELCHCIGEDEGVALGRRALYQVGIGLGEKARKRLGVGDSLKDTLLAARIMYKVLGIEFTFRPEGDGGTLFVKRCALSDHYSGRTCRVLSAADEGVLRGLNPLLTMRFMETIPDGAEGCKAKIIIDDLR